MQNCDARGWIETQNKSLTEKFAKKSREGRREPHLLFLARFADVLRGLCG
jgi:hypothetical protein